MLRGQEHDRGARSSNDADLFANGLLWPEIGEAETSEESKCEGCCELRGMGER